MALDHRAERTLLVLSLRDGDRPLRGPIRRARCHQAHQPPLGGHDLGEDAPGPRARRQRAGLALFDRQELRRDHVSVVRPVVGRLREHARNQLIELVRDRRPEVAEARQLVRSPVEQQAERVGPAERRSPREAPVQHAAEREDVRAAVQVRHVVDLLGGDVARRAQHRARHRELWVGDRPARHPEVDQRDLVDRAATQEQVARLDIAMHDAAPVDGGQRRRHAPAEGQALGERDLRPLEARRQGLAREPLHHQVGLPLGGDPVVDVPHDPGVGERRQDVSFARETLDLEPLRVVHHLERHQPSGSTIARPIDLPHPPGACQMLDRESVVDDLSAARHPSNVQLTFLHEAWPPRRSDQVHESGYAAEPQAGVCVLSFF